MADAAWKIIEEVEGKGGMTAAVDSGWAKLKIEAAAAQKQALIDSGKEVIVGVNKYKLAKEDPVDILEVDNVKVRDSQIARLNSIKQKRDAAQVQQALAALTSAAESGTGNLLDLAIKAIRLRATVGEVSDALEKAFGRHRAGHGVHRLLQKRLLTGKSHHIRRSSLSETQFYSAKSNHNLIFIQ
jgi:methylmalonyl-CoA mutase